MIRKNKHLIFISCIVLLATWCTWGKLEASAANPSPPKTASNLDSPVLAIPDTSAAAGSTILIPVYILHNPGITRVQFRLAYNATILKSPEVRQSTISKQFTFESTFSSGDVSVSMNTNEAIFKNGILVYIKFDVNSEARPKASTTLRLQDVVMLDSSQKQIQFVNSKDGKFTVAKSVVTVVPNPFTPNRDGYNDIVEFRFPGLTAQGIEILIFDASGRRVQRLTLPAGEVVIWNGTGEDGRELSPGLYIYLVKFNSQEQAKGTITLIR